MTNWKKGRSNWWGFINAPLTFSSEALEGAWIDLVGYLSVPKCFSGEKPEDYNILKANIFVEFLSVIN